MEHKVYCNGEILCIDGKYVTDCCESLDETFSSIASALGAKYQYIDQDENERLEEN